jgi:hypothetical protein
MERALTVEDIVTYIGEYGNSDEPFLIVGRSQEETVRTFMDTLHKMDYVPTIEDCEEWSIDRSKNLRYHLMCLAIFVASYNEGYEDGVDVGFCQGQASVYLE